MLLQERPAKPRVTRNKQSKIPTSKLKVILFWHWFYILETPNFPSNSTKNEAHARTTKTRPLQISSSGKWISALKKLSEMPKDPSIWHREQNSCATSLPYPPGFSRGVDSSSTWRCREDKQTAFRSGIPWRFAKIGLLLGFHKDSRSYCWIWLVQVQKYNTITCRYV